MGADDNDAMHTPFLPTGGACRLPSWGVLHATGADAASFLHGQLSNDISHLDGRQAHLAAYCNAQGRMLASLVCARRDADTLVLLCQADVLPATLKRLSMFVLRAKAKLSDASVSQAVVGLVGDAGSTWLGDAAPAATWGQATLAEAVVVRLPDAVVDHRLVPRWLWIGPSDAADATLAALPALAEPHWQWLDVASGIAQVVAATTAQFVPQMLNYELVGGVDFRKGCYPGQEVVARSQYLGKLKRRAFLLAGDAAMAPGQEVHWSGDAAQPAGQIATSATAPDGSHLALAELKVGAVGDGELHLGTPHGPVLRVQPLPYAVPADGGRNAVA
jgi:folate-binding protein YgfZ